MATDSGPQTGLQLARADLFALGEEALVALSNRGLVKRALRDLAADRAPTLTVEADGTVVGRIDEVVTTLAPGVSLAATTCSCGAVGVCRHRLAVVLTFRAQAQASTVTQAGSGPVERWSPGVFTDEELVARVGTTAMARARRSERRGFVAVVQRPTADRPVPTVRLPTTAVRFLVPQDLAYATTDAAAGSDDEAGIALAVWAFRAADDRDAEADQVEVDVGAALILGDEATAVLGDATDLADLVLLDGVVNVDQTFDARIEKVRRGLDRAGLRWPLGALEELTDQLGWYRNRSARYRSARVVDLLAELHARHRASSNGSEVTARQVLGSQASAETELRHLRLVGLGARVTGSASEQHIEVYLAHPEARTVLVMQRDRSYGPASARGRGQPPTSVDQAGRTFAAGISLDRFARGTITTESAIRRPDHELKIVAGRLTQSTVTTADLRTWESLPEPVLVSDLAALAERLAQRPPTFIGRRVLAENFHVFVVDSVDSIVYRPGLQRLDAVLVDPLGNRALVSREHRTLAAGAIGVLECALSAEKPPRMLSGMVRATAEGLVIDPVAIATDDGLMSLDLAVVQLAAETAPVHGNVDPHVGSDPRSEVLSKALDVMTDAAQRGLRYSPAGFADRVRDVSDELVAVGLSTTADEVRVFAAAIAGVTGDAAIMEDQATTAWTNVVLRLRTLQLA